MLATCIAQTTGLNPKASNAYTNREQQLIDTQQISKFSVRIYAHPLIYYIVEIQAFTDYA